MKLVGGMFFEDWGDLVRVDLVVTVALGSLLATIARSSNVSLTEGVAAFMILVAAQWAFSWASLRRSFVRRLVRAEPAVVFADGTFDGNDATRASKRLIPGKRGHG